MVLNDLIDTTIIDDSLLPIKCKKFRVAISIPESDKIYYSLPVTNYDRLDLLSLQIYGIEEKQDLLLEFTDTPYFEWYPNDQIKHVSTRIAEQIG